MGNQDNYFESPNRAVWIEDDAAHANFNLITHEENDADTAHDGIMYRFIPAYPGNPNISADGLTWGGWLTIDPVTSVLAGHPNNKYVSEYASIGGQYVPYHFTVWVNDQHGGKVSQDFDLVVQNAKPEFLTVPSASYGTSANPYNMVLTEDATAFKFDLLNNDEGQDNTHLITPTADMTVANGTALVEDGRLAAVGDPNAHWLDIDARDEEQESTEPGHYKDAYYVLSVDHGGAVTFTQSGRYWTGPRCRDTSERWPWRHRYTNIQIHRGRSQGRFTHQCAAHDGYSC